MWTYMPMQLSYQLPVSCRRYSAVLWYTVQLSAIRPMCTEVMAVTMYQYCGTVFECVSYSSFPFFFYLYEYSICFFRNVERSNSITDLERPRGFQEVEAPRFQSNRYMKVVRSALHTGHLYPQGNIPGTLFIVLYRCTAHFVQSFNQHTN